MHREQVAYLLVSRRSLFKAKLKV